MLILKSYLILRASPCGLARLANYLLSTGEDKLEMPAQKESIMPMAKLF